ncbi:MAG: ribbon-helix-helix protein, CopG family [Spirochaetaceae bacterium]|nr:ribbon-helix-helix protein, CopG family [Spirochaetaceae bacterium]
MTQPVVIRLDTMIIERLNELARKTGRTKSYYIKEAIEENLVDMELVYLAQSRAEDVRKGKSKTISWEEVKQQNGLQD